MTSRARVSLSCNFGVMQFWYRGGSFTLGDEGAPECCRAVRRPAQKFHSDCPAQNAKDPRGGNACSAWPIRCLQFQLPLPTQLSPWRRGCAEQICSRVRRIDSVEFREPSCAK